MKNFRIEFKWAIFFSLFNLLWMFGEKAIGLHDAYIAKHGIYTLLITLPFIAVVYCCIREKKRQYYEGILTWTQGVMTGTVLSTIIAAIYPLSLYLMLTYISPDFFENIISYQVEKGSEPSRMQTFYNYRSYLIQGVSYHLALGIVISAIVASFLKTSKK